MDRKLPSMYSIPVHSGQVQILQHPESQNKGWKLTHDRPSMNITLEHGTQIQQKVKVDSQAWKSQYLQYTGT